MNIFFYLINTLCLALTAIGITKFMLDDGSWVNYFIIAASLFTVISIAGIWKKLRKVDNN